MQIQFAELLDGRMKIVLFAGGNIILEQHCLFTNKPSVYIAKQKIQKVTGGQKVSIGAISQMENSPFRDYFIRALAELIGYGLLQEAGVEIPNEILTTS